MYNDKTKSRTMKQREKFLKIFREVEQEGVTNSELKDVSFNYTARIAEMRKMGYKFDVTDLGDGLYNYVLVEEPEEIKSQKRAVEIFWDLIGKIESDTISKDQLKTILEANNFNVVRNWGCNL